MSADESQLSYALPKSSSSDEEVDSYPPDNLTGHDEILSHLKSDESFQTDKFPLELTHLPVIEHMPGTLGHLNRKVFAICEQARRFVNLIYRTDPILNENYQLEEIWRLRHESYRDLLKLNLGESGLQSLVKMICKLGGPCYKPPAKLWTYLHFFWFDSDSADTDGSSVTREPYAAPSFQTFFFAQKGDAAIMIATLKEEFVDWENTPLVEELKCLTLTAEQYWKSHKADGSGTSDADDLFGKLLQMEKDVKQKLSLQTGDKKVFPTLLQNLLNHFKEEKKN